MFPFVRYKILLRFSIILYFVSLFLLLLMFFFLFFFCWKDNVLFPNAVERNFQAFNLLSTVQYYSKSFHDTKTSISTKSFRPLNSPYFLRKPRTRNTRTNGLEQMVVPSWLEQRAGGGAGVGGGGEWVRPGREAKNASKNTIKNKRKKKMRVSPLKS